MTSLLQVQLADRSLALYLGALGVVAGGVIAAQILRRLILRSNTVQEGATVGRPSREIVDRIVRSLLLPSVHLGALYAASRIIDIKGTAKHVVDTILLVLLIWFVARFATVALRIALGRYFERSGQTGSEQRLRPLHAFANLTIWLIGAVFLLDNLGFKISSIVAGLGIGGIMVALAGQAILGDLFSYFVILFDRPFELGDFIIIGDLLGTIEAIGIKTTKIRSISGEQIVLTNSQLTNSKLHNYKRMEKRRVVFALGVTYGTSRDKLASIPAIIRKAIERQPNVTFDRSHFKEFGESSLNFESVYYIASPDYNMYMDIQQAINLQIYEDFRRGSIGFAFPTRTVHIEPLVPTPAGSR